MVASTPIMPELRATPQQRRTERLRFPRAKSYISELDIVRAVACASVVAVHVMGMVRGLDSATGQTEVIGGIFSTLWHFTRESFMMMTGLVLVYSYSREPFPIGRFFGRRTVERIIPYILWSMVYVLIYYPRRDTLGWWIHFGHDLLLGGASYQLYAMSVNMQFYVVFPLLLWILTRLRSSHVPLLLISLAAQLFWYVDVAHLPPGQSPFPFITQNVIHFIFTYPFFFMVGAVWGMHVDEVRTFIDRHRRPVAALSVLTGLILLGRYALIVIIQHRPTPIGADVYEPAMVFWSLGAVALMWLWGRRLTGPLLSIPQRLTAFLAKSVSKASYGIFIVHVLFLRIFFADFATRIGGGAAIQFLVLWAMTFAASFLLTRLLLALPLLRLALGDVQWSRPHALSAPPPTLPG